MAVIAVAGGPGAPGATTAALALLLAWPLESGRRVLLVEADPDGGAVLAGALEGRVDAVYGLRNLAVADRRGLLAQTIWEQLIDLSPEGTAERLLLPGLTDPTQAPGLAYTWEPLADLLHGLEPQGYDVIVDLGRSGATGVSAVLARRADVVAVTVRTTLRGLSSARPRLSVLAEDLATAGTGADALGLLLVAEGPYSGAEVSREFGLPVLGLLPHATRTARVLSDGGDITDRRFIRSELMRTARSAADEVQLLVRRRRQRLAPTAAPIPAQLTAATRTEGQPQPQTAAHAQPPVPTPQAPSPTAYRPVEEEQPSYAPPTPPQPVAPVITTGPVAPLAGLAPHPAAPAPFPGHAQQPQPPYGPQAGYAGYDRQAGAPYDRQAGFTPYDQQAGAPYDQAPSYVRPEPEDDGRYPLQQPAATPDQTHPNGPQPYNPGEVLRAR
ncbi:hypothetical protein ACIPLC_14210 [Kitasatospora sp. NPDC086801]|uniref:hypothetical protein n=1 Tax=Kitasatospora sp. NPDC086801 TaxID=3364066 RepID=UPI0037F5044C